MRRTLTLILGVALFGILAAVVVASQGAGDPVGTATAASETVDLTTTAEHNDALVPDDVNDNDDQGDDNDDQGGDVSDQPETDDQGDDNQGDDNDDQGEVENGDDNGDEVESGDDQGGEVESGDDNGGDSGESGGADD